MSPAARPVLLLLLALLAPESPRVATVLPSGLKTVETLTAFEPKGSGPERLRPSLGLRFGTYLPAGVEVRAVTPGSPAAAGGLLPGDVVRSIGRYRIGEAEDLERALASLRVGVAVPIGVRRPAVRREVTVEVRPDEEAGGPGFEFRHTQGHFEVTRVRGGSAAARAGLRAGDCFTQVDRVVHSTATQLRRALRGRSKFALLLQREERSFQADVTPGGEKEEVVDWKGKTFRLAVLLVEFSDRRHHPEYDREDFERMLFSTGEYSTSPDGRATHGSLRDYWREVSVGTFDVQGRVFDWVTVPGTWSYYDAQGMGGGEPGTRTVFEDALAGALGRFGANALDAFDGVVFLYAGERESQRGSQLWPHRASVAAGGRDLPYYIIEEGGVRFASIGVHCHEFGHMLGLPDFYGYGHRTGVGKFCLMAIGSLGGEPSGSDRPFHLCAWCKIRLGWLRARTVLPGERQHIALRPVEGRANEAVKILLSPTAEEYYLLEVRGRTGFDGDFFREGLLIWHYGDEAASERGQIAVPIDLVEAHGKRYFDASLREESDVLFPTDRLGAFTPLTVPGTAGGAGAGGYQVVLTDIQVYSPPSPPADADIPPGSVLLRIGDLSRAPRERGEEPEQPVYPEDEPVMEVDPVTNRPVPFRVDRNGVAAPGPAILPRTPDK